MCSQKIKYTTRIAATKQNKKKYLYWAGYKSRGNKHVYEAGRVLIHKFQDILEQHIFKKSPFKVVKLTKTQTPTYHTIYKKP